MSQFQTRVHIAGPVEGKLQRCARCGIVLIDSTGAMSIDRVPMGYWLDGGWVGVIEACDDSLVKPVCTVAMKHDAIESDEVRCQSSVAPCQSSVALVRRLLREIIAETETVGSDWGGPDVAERAKRCLMLIGATAAVQFHETPSGKAETGTQGGQE